MWTLPWNTVKISRGRINNVFFKSYTPSLGMLDHTDHISSSCPSGIMQMHCPSTLTTAKTRQATRIVLKRQEYIVKNIQQSRALGQDGAILEKVKHITKHSI